MKKLNTKIKATLVACAMVCSGSVFAKVVGNISYVEGFIESTANVQNLLQVNTNANYSCGPTSLLFVENYFWNKSFPSMDYWPATDYFSARYALRQIYDGIPGKSFNTSQGTDTDELKSFVKNTWDWGTAVKASGSNSINTNLLSMVNRIGQDYPVILALEANYSDNPIGGFAHIVVFYKYDASTEHLYYFDPYYGGTHSIHKNNLANAIQGNLPYLRIAP